MDFKSFDDPAQLGEYLRSRRQALTPEEVGFVRAGLRRTPGLRREEVAILAGISVDYYERIERSRATNPSADLVARLAGALRLDDDETDYLHHLAGHAAPAAAATTPGEVDPGLIFLLDSLEAVPAHVFDGLTNVIAQNELSVELFGQCLGRPGRQQNMTWRWFTDPQVRAYSAPDEHEALGRGWAASLRAAQAERGHDAAIAELVAELVEASEEFASYWATMDVWRFRTMRKTFIHPAVGVLQVHCEMVLGSFSGQHLMMMRPEPHTGTAERFSQLAASLDGDQRAS